MPILRHDCINCVCRSIPVDTPQMPSRFQRACSSQTVLDPPPARRLVLRSSPEAACPCEPCADALSCPGKDRQRAFRSIILMIHGNFALQDEQGARVALGLIRGMATRQNVRSPARPAGPPSGEAQDLSIGIEFIDSRIHDFGSAQRTGLSQSGVLWIFRRSSQCMARPKSSERSLKPIFHPARSCPLQNRPERATR
jgi:hypothetical protein